MKSKFKCRSCGNKQAMIPEADLDFETCEECGECGEWLMIRARAEVVVESEPMLPAKLETLTALELFDTDKIKEVVNFVTEKARAHKPDTSTDKGRKAIASNAARVSKSKTWLESIGKPASGKIKAEAKTLDASRKYMKDTLDTLRDEMRQPLTDWEESEKARIAAEELAEQVKTAHGEAIAEDDLFNRAREIERKEAKLAKIEADRVAKEEEEKAKQEAAATKEREEKEQAARDEQIRKEAAAKAKREEAEKLVRAKEAKQKAIQGKKDAARKAEQDRIDAEKRAEEEKRLAVEAEQRKTKEAAEQAEVDKKEWIIREKEKAEQRESDRLAKEAADQKEAEEKAADRDHRDDINGEIYTYLIETLEIDASIADNIVADLEGGNIPHTKINY